MTRAIATDLNIASDRPETARISALHARAFGPGRFARTAYRLREGTAEFSPFCRVCRVDGQLAAAVRFTPILIGGKGGALLLGPLAVDPAFANQGHGRGLVATALEAARTAGIALVVLVGDEPYYARLSFRPVPRGRSCCRARSIRIGCWLPSSRSTRSLAIQALLLPTWRPLRRRSIAPQPLASSDIPRRNCARRVAASSSRLWSLPERIMRAPMPM